MSDANVNYNINYNKDYKGLTALGGANKNEDEAMIKIITDFKLKQTNN